MPYTNTPSTTGENVNVLPGAGQYKTGLIAERVTGMGASGYLQLQTVLPANARIVWATLNNRTAITPRAASSASATNVAIMGVALVWTAPTSLATGGTTANAAIGMIQTAFGASVASNSQARGLAPVAATGGGFVRTSHYDSGVGTSPVSLYVIPYASTVATDANGVGRFYVVASTGTSQYTLNGTGTATTGTTTADFDVQVYWESFGDTVSVA